MLKSEIRPSHNITNETKHDILKTIYYSADWLTPMDVALAVGISYTNASKILSKLHLFGYLHRRRETRSGHKNYWCYRYLKPKGTRVFKGHRGRIGLEERVKIREVTGIFVSLDLRKPIPRDAWLSYQSICSYENLDIYVKK